MCANSPSLQVSACRFVGVQRKVRLLWTQSQSAAASATARLGSLVPFTKFRPDRRCMCTKCTSTANCRQFSEYMGSPLRKIETCCRQRVLGWSSLLPEPKCPSPRKIVKQKKSAASVRNCGHQNNEHDRANHFHVLHTPYSNIKPFFELHSNQSLLLQYGIRIPLFHYGFLSYFI